MNICKKAVQVKYGVAYYLPWPVVGNVSTPVYFIERGSRLLQCGFVQQLVFFFAAFAQRVYGAGVRKTKGNCW